jgi:hypothetical protein
LESGRIPEWGELKRVAVRCWRLRESRLAQENAQRDLALTFFPYLLGDFLAGGLSRVKHSFSVRRRALIHQYLEPFLRYNPISALLLLARAKRRRNYTLGV